MMTTNRLISTSSVKPNVKTGHKGLESSYQALADNFEGQTFDFYESQALGKLGQCLARPQLALAFLSLRESDLRIRHFGSYFESVRRGVRPGEGQSVTDLKAKRRRAEIAARQHKADVYAVQIIESTADVDSCRSLYRYLTTSRLELVRPEDSLNLLVRRVRRLFEELLESARIKDVFVRGHSERVVSNLLNKFDNGSLEARQQLVGLTGQNAAAKAHLWLNNLESVSNQYRFVDNQTKLNLLAHHELRREDYVAKFNVVPKSLLDQAQKLTVVS